MSMKKGFQHKWFAVTIVVCALIIGIAVMNVGDKKAGIDGNKVDFRYPFFSVKLLMGKPDKEIKIAESDLTAYHYFDRTFFGQKGSITYDVHLFRVDRIILEMSTSDEAAYTLFSTISQSIESVYKDRAGYYCSPVVQKEDGKLIQNIGVNKGAGGISFTLSYLNGELRLDGAYQ